MSAGLNAPDPDEHIRLAEGEHKVEYVVDTRMADTGTFVLNKEDHTLGNLLRMALLRDRRVVFAGYRMPHPLEFRCHLKIRTSTNTDPVNVMLDAIECVGAEVKSLQQQVNAELNRQMGR